MLMAQVVHIISIQFPEVSDTWKEGVKSNVFVSEIKSYQSFRVYSLKKTGYPLSLLLLFYQEALCRLGEK